MNLSYTTNDVIEVFVNDKIVKMELKEGIFWTIKIFSWLGQSWYHLST